MTEGEGEGILKEPSREHTDRRSPSDREEGRGRKGGALTERQRQRERD